ncbi:MAG: efflux transporter periplasmic adaptor subunit, partial [Acidobacteriota bacterium]
MRDGNKRVAIHCWGMYGLLRPFLAIYSVFGFFVAAGLFVLVAGLYEASSAQTASIPEVEVMTVTQKDVPVYSEWVGTTEGLVNVTIRAQVTG